MLCVCVCGFVHDEEVVATSSVEFHLNEFICLTNVTRAWKFSARRLVPVRALHWVALLMPRVSHKPTQATLIKPCHVRH